MITHICDDCAFVSKGIRYNTTKPYGLPKDWIAITINNLQSCVCGWQCAERLCQRMAANKEHPGDDVSTDRPARVGPAVVMPKFADTKAQKTFETLCLQDDPDAETTQITERDVERSEKQCWERDS